jgi:hypothetical protein
VISRNEGSSNRKHVEDFPEIGVKQPYEKHFKEIKD